MQQILRLCILNLKFVQKSEQIGGRTLDGRLTMRIKILFVATVRSISLNAA